MFYSIFEFIYLYGVEICINILSLSTKLYILRDFMVSIIYACAIVPSDFGNKYFSCKLIGLFINE